MNRRESELSVERRVRLARKGQVLVGKSCGTGGLGRCAEAFARHQLRLGHIEVVCDLLAFLNSRLAALRADDPQGLFAMTEALAARIARLVENKD